MNREMAVAKWAVDNNKAAGCFTETLSSADALYIPLKGSFDTVGVLAYQAKTHSLPIEDMDFLFMVARLLAASLERDNFRKRALEAERLSESEKLHQTLLQLLVSEAKSWISHKEDEKELSFMMDNFLVVSRLSTGIFPLKKEQCDLKQIIDIAINKIKYAISHQSVTIRSEFNVLPVMLDRDLFVQALSNILLNAARNSFPNKEILIEMRSFEISISDQGPGVEEEYLGRIFDKFYKTESDKKKGYGLGLAVAKGVIKAHEGKVFAVNRLSGGLKIVISLPSEVVK
jgi:two-component system sensor histidine kinase KdpD